MVNVASIWHTALERLDTFPVDAVSRSWLQEASLTQVPFAGEDEFSLTIPNGEEVLYFLLDVADERVRNTLNVHWRPTIEDILAEITEQPVSLSIVHEANESTSMHERERDRLFCNLGQNI